MKCRYKTKIWIQVYFDLKETRSLKQSVRRNDYRFPDDFMFQLNKIEWQELITNCDNLPESIKFSHQTIHEAI